jgi:hypothetical protein
LAYPSLKQVGDDIAKTAAEAKSAMILTAILTIVLIVAVFYILHERRRIDDLQNGPPSENEITVADILETTHLRLFVTLSTLAAIFGALYLTYYIVKTEKRDATTLVYAFVIGLLGYVGFRIFLSSLNITTEKATAMPTFVYESIKNVENMASMGAFILLGFLVSLHVFAKPPPSMPTGSGKGAEYVPGGFIDFSSLNAIQRRAVTASS